MDGYQVAMLLRQKPECKDVIMCALTGYTPSEADRQREQNSGFDDDFVKPVELAKMQDLFKKVRATSIAR